MEELVPATTRNKGVLVFLAATLLLVLAVGVRLSNDRQPLPAGVCTVTVTGNGPVLHAVGRKTSTGDSDDTDREEVHELWYDERSGDTSHEVRDASGQILRKKTIRGRTMEEFNRPGSYSRVTAPSLDSPMRHAGEVLLIYRSWYLRSQADPWAVMLAGINSRRVLIDGQPCVEFTGAVLERFGTESVLVEPITQLPLLMTNASNGASSRVRWSYAIIEMVEAIPDEALVVESDGELSQESMYFNHQDARTFSDYPIYYLGVTFDGIPTFGRKSTDYGQGKRWFQVLYAEPFVNGIQKRGGKVTVETRPLADPGEGTPLIGFDGTVATVDGEIVKRRADLESSRTGNPVELQIGSSRVRLSGIKKKDLRAVIASLRRLNDLAPTVKPDND
jgi:hypothetical protein